MKWLRPFFVTFMLIASSIMVLVSNSPPATSEVLTTFGDGSSSVTITFPNGGGNDNSLEIVLPSGVKVTGATLNVSGHPASAALKDYPTDVAMDVGNNGTYDWAWTGNGYGSLGRQTIFSDGTDTISYTMTKAGSDTRAHVLLPQNAMATNSTFELSGGKMEYFEEVVKYYGKAWDFIGYDLDNVGDVNGDGYPDLLATAPHENWQDQDFGHGYIFYGGPNPSGNPDIDLVGGQIGSFYGYRAAGAGDVNNDGYDDVIIGAYDFSLGGGQSGNGRAYLYYGGDPMDNFVDLMFTGVDSEYLASDVAGIGDVNGDGFDDILIGASGNDYGPYGWDDGAAYIYFGGAPMNNVADIHFNGTSGAEFGVFTSMAGDIDGDGYEEFMIGADWDSSATNNDGAVYIYNNKTGIDNVSEYSLQPVTGNYFGSQGRGVGDVNGDGFDDIAIQNDYNSIYMYFGGSPFDTTRDDYTSGEFPSDLYGMRISGAGDLNKDGFDDMLVGATDWNNSYARGKIYFYKGGDPFNLVPDKTWNGTEEWDEFAAVEQLGDYNGDGFLEIAIGGDGVDEKAPQAGVVIVLSYKMGLKEPSFLVQPSAGVLWSNSTYFRGKTVSGNFSSQLANALVQPSVPIITDANGNKLGNLTFELKTKERGDLTVKNLSIEYDAAITVSDFAKALDTYMTGHSPGNDGKFHIPIRFFSSTSGKLEVSGLLIQFGQAPQGVAPTGLTLPEGGYNMTFLDLYTVFQDDADMDVDLTYAVVNNTNSDYVKATIQMNRYLGLDASTQTANANWTGTTRILVTATDKTLLRSEPLAIDVEVVQVKDAPFITSAPVLTVKEGQKYIYDVEAVDGDIGDTLTYSVMSTATSAGMSIDPQTGLLTWYPTFKDAGKFMITVNVTDGTLYTVQTFTLTVELRQMAGNHLPFVTSAPPIWATVGYTYEYQIKAVDDDGDILTFSLVESPTTMTVDGKTGLVQWTPGIDDAPKIFDVIINISDGFDRSFHSWKIGVNLTGMNHLPVIVGLPPAKAYVGVQYYFKFTATDEDNDQVTFRLASGPTGLTINPDGGLTWVSTSTQVGPNKFTVEASDGKAYVRKEFLVNVAVNHKPAVTSQPVLDAKVGKSYKYALTVEDLDPLDSVNVSLARYPPGMTYDSASKTLSWKPGKKQTGAFEVSIKVNDGIQDNYQNFTVTVKGEKAPTLFEQTGLLLLIILVVIIATIAGVFVYMRMKKKVAEAKTIIEDVFLTYRDGRLIAHSTRRIKPEQDEHTMTAMLTAIQSFVQDSVPTEGEAQKPIEEISFGKDRILMQHGTYVYIAAVIKGTETETMKARMSDAIRKIETQFGDKLKEWDGDLRDLEGAKAITRELAEQ